MNAHTGQVELVKKLTDCINSERSLMKFVKAFLFEREQTNQEDQDEDEDAGDNGASGDEDNDACEVLNTELQN